MSTKKRSYLDVVSTSATSERVYNTFMPLPSSPKTESVLSMHAKRLRNMEHSFGEKRAVDMLAAPGGMSFDPDDVLVLLGIRQDCEAVKLQLKEAKDALNLTGSRSDTRRVRARLVVSVLQTVKAQYDQSRALESEPASPDIDCFVKELNDAADTFNQRTMDIEAQVCERAVQTMNRIPDVRVRQLECFKEAENAMQVMFQKVDTYKQAMETDMDKQQSVCSDVSRQKTLVDRGICSLLKEQSEKRASGVTEELNITTFLDAIHSSDDQMRAMLDQRKRLGEKECTENKELQAARNGLNFAESVRRLLLTVRDKNWASFKAVLANGNNHRETVVRECTSALNDHLPRFAETVLRLLNQHHNRQIAAQKKAEKYKEKLKDHDLLFVNEAPSERASITRKIDEFSRILTKSKAAVNDLIQENEKSWLAIMLDTPGGRKTVESLAAVSSRQPIEIDLSHPSGSSSELHLVSTGTSDKLAKHLPLLTKNLTMPAITTIRSTLAFLKENARNHDLGLSVGYLLQLATRLSPGGSALLQLNKDKPKPPPIPPRRTSSKPLIEATQPLSSVYNGLHPIVEEVKPTRPARKNAPQELTVVNHRSRKVHTIPRVAVVKEEKEEKVPAFVKKNVVTTVRSERKAAFGVSTAGNSNPNITKPTTDIPGGDKKHQARPTTVKGNTGNQENEGNCCIQ